MTGIKRVHVDAVIFGGGSAGLWLLDELVRHGYETLLLEAHELGSGQTVTSQGIIHGGLKYTLTGALSPSAKMIREMPLIWRRCLAAERKPDLSRTLRRSEYCHIWQTKSLASRIGMIGARRGLRIKPEQLAPEERPAVLRECPGVVARLDEQVIDPQSMMIDLASQHEQRILKIDLAHGFEFELDGPGEVRAIRLINPDTGAALNIEADHTILTAGAGNAELRELAGLDSAIMQRRPLHMVIARGKLPLLNGHCVDGMHTRATITTAQDYANRRIWQVGGQLAEDGVTMETKDLIRHAARELSAVLPGVDMREIEWATHRVDRAEPTTRGVLRPNDIWAQIRGRVITAWPTKLALAPRLAEQILTILPNPAGMEPIDGVILEHWPRPAVASPPWEEGLSWHSAD